MGLIDNWFVRIENPNTKAGIWDLLSMSLGYYEEYISIDKFNEDSIDLIYLREDLKEAGFDKLRKSYYYNVSFRKIKGALKNLNNIVFYYNGSIPNFQYYNIGYLLHLYDNGVRFIKNNK